MEQLELAIQYLKNRAVSTEEVDNELMKQFIKVLPVSEVEAVLEMVKQGTFSDFYYKIKEETVKIPLSKNKIQARWVNGLLIGSLNEYNFNFFNILKPEKPQ